MSSEAHCPGLYVVENEEARFWLSVIVDLQNRGLKDIIIASVDNLKGRSNAIRSVSPSDISLLKLLYLVQKNVSEKMDHTSNGMIRL